MLLSNLQGSSSLSTFHVEYVALLQSMRNLVSTKTLVSEVVKAVGPDTKRLDFSTQSTVSEDNYGAVKATQNHNFPIITQGYNDISLKYHLFREKIYSGDCSVKKVEGKEHKANIFNKGIQGEILLHIKIYSMDGI